MKKAVLIRLDKIGDLICTLPVDQVEFFGDWDITWIIAKGLGFVPDHAEPKREYLELDKAGTSEARHQLDQLLKSLRPDVAISFQAPWWVHFALWKNRVPQRLGVLSKWHSFLFLNQGLRQKRSKATQHEADYNLDLVKLLSKSTPNQAPTLKLRAPVLPNLLASFNLIEKSYDVVHPGMAGSALNWPTTSYISLIESLISKRTVVMTGTAADEPWLKDLKEHFKHEPKVMVLQSRLSPPELLVVLAKAHQVFAPSTGVLHLAASLGVHSVGFYSPIQVQHPRRWAARGPDVQVLAPEVRCPAVHQCHGPACPYFNCMTRITPEQALKAGV